jgi:GTP-binding protein Era
MTEPHAPAPDPPPPATRAGIVTVVGRPNAGKSTLLNRVVGEKLAITSEKPQSTRDRVVGIRTRDGVQMVFFDTPGLLEPRYALHEAMRAAAVTAVRDADVVVYLADATRGIPVPLAEAAGLTDEPRVPILLTLNKADLLDDDARSSLAASAPHARFVSAASGEGIDDLLSDLSDRLPVSPFLYPDDEISTQSMRFFAAELVRETALEQLGDEVPYSIACEIDEYREAAAPVYIRAVLYVERESQKGIVIGARGARLRDIGRVARGKIETLVGAAVYLDLWVKVLPNWRRDARALRRFGYTSQPGTKP